VANVFSCDITTGIFELILIPDGAICNLGQLYKPMVQFFKKKKKVVSRIMLQELRGATNFLLESAYPTFMYLHKCRAINSKWFEPNRPHKFFLRTVLKKPSLTILKPSIIHLF